MSRGDEALRLAARTAAAGKTAKIGPSPADAIAGDELRVHVVDPAILERFGVERQARPPLESVKPAPTPITRALHIEPAERPRALDQAKNPKLVVSGQLMPVAIEQYRRLAAVLHEHRIQHGLKTLTVSS